jgi:hypothetical protein
MIGIVSLSSSSPLGDRRPRGSYQLWYDAPRNQEAMMKTTAETTSHRMAGEPLSSLQCHHGRYSSATSHHVVVWPYDHNYNHTQTCAARRHSLRAKLARSSLRLTTFKSGDLLLCMCPLYKGSQGTHLRDPTFIHLFLHRRRAPKAYLQAARLLTLTLLPLPPFLHPIVRTSEHSNEKHALDHL